MPLKMDTKMIHTVDMYDLNDFVQETYGVSLDFIAREECGNDTTHAFYVDGVVCNDYEMDINAFLSGEPDGYAMPTQAFLDYMARYGRIPTGNYIVSVSW